MVYGGINYVGADDEGEPILGFCIESARSGRSGCRTCGSNIAHATARVGQIEHHEEYGQSTKWFHPWCFVWSRHDGRLEEIPGFSHMAAADKKLLRDCQAGKGAPPPGTPGQVGWVPLPMTLQARQVPMIAPADGGGASSSAVVDLTQEDTSSEDPEAIRDQDVLYGQCSLLCVGIQHYNGVLHAGEFAILEREPTNPYDANAVKVVNHANSQVGHLKRNFANALAPLLDDPSPLAPRVEAAVHQESTGKFNLTLRTSFFGPLQLAEVTVRYLASHQISLQNGSPEVRAIFGQEEAAGGAASGSIVSSTQVTATSTARLEMLFDDLAVDASTLDFSLHSEAAGRVLKSILLPHQEQGVAWMVKREKSTALPPFWKEVSEGGARCFFNEITNTSYSAAPPPVSGGLLCDDMGLGKTLQVLTLVIANPPDGIVYQTSAPSPQPPTAEKRQKVEDSSESGDMGADNSWVSAAGAAVEGVEGEVGGGVGRGVGGGVEGGVDGGLLLGVLGLTPPELNRLKVAALRQKAIDHGLDPSGTKKQILAKFAAAFPSPGGASALPPAPLQSNGSNGAAATGGGPRGTLVVAPASVLLAWEGQSRTHLAEGALKVMVFHAGNKCSAKDLADYDLVITSYSTLSAELASIDTAGKVGGKKRKKASGGIASLLAADWHRVVLDEAHTIRNIRTKTFKACNLLKGKLRWCLSGTPIVNRAEDVQALFSFVRAQPLDDPGVFTRAIGRPMRDGDALGAARLRVIMRSLCLRRGKDLLKDSIPPRALSIVRVRLDQAHQEAYDAIFDSASALVNSLLGDGPQALLSQYSGVLECLLRLRQVCDSLSLLPPDRLQRAREVALEVKRLTQKNAASGKAAPLNATEAKRLLDKLQKVLVAPSAGEEGGQGSAFQGEAQAEKEDEQVFECAICLGDLEPSMARILRACSHAFCEYCIEKVAATAHGGHVACPMCRAPFQMSDILGATQLQLQVSALAAEEASAKEKQVQPEVAPEAAVPLEPIPLGNPPKVAALLQGLREEWAADPTQKAVVFSQFTGMLNIVQKAIKEEFGEECCRIDGSMAVAQRGAHLERFSQEEGPRVILVSLKAGGQGITLTRANLVYMCDIWWNYSTEEQAMDRVHRIGQTRPTRVVRYVCDNTIEERMLAVQDSKRLMGEEALQRLTPEQARATRVSDLRHIFSRGETSAP